MLNEDPGHAGKKGIESPQKMWAELDGRPLHVVYRVTVTVVRGDERTRVWGRNTRKLDTGHQRSLFIS